MTHRLLVLLASLALSTAAGAADVSVRFYPFGPTSARPGLPHFLSVVAANHTTSEPASNIRVRVTFDPSLVVESAGGWQFPCDVTPGLVDCTYAELTRGNEAGFSFRLRTPASPEGGELTFRAEITSTTPDPDLTNNVATTTVHSVRQHVVSNTNDSGPGSLRAAIEGANGWCTVERPCDITFDFPEGPIPVIEPLSPLPPITACGVLVGNKKIFGQPAPIQVEVSGRRLSSGHGLVLHSACGYDQGMELVGMAINGFPGEGIAITGPANYSLFGFAVGTDAAGTRAIPNGQRGIAQHTGRLSLYESLVGGNVRSGIAVFGGHTDIVQTRIGIGDDGRDLGNGASGIFLAPSARDLQISDSIIANHPHFGIALASSWRVKISDSTVIKDNILDLDWFLDGPTARIDRADIPPTPRILSANYDSLANVTRVTVALQGPAGDHTRIRVYASDRITIFGTAHLEKVVGYGTPHADPFTISMVGDLRGKYISAVNARWTVAPDLGSPPPTMISTSEVSAAVKVE